MRTLLLLALALPFAACGDASDNAGDAATAQPVPLERTPEGGVVDQRAEAVVVTGMTAGERWCEIAYETADGTAATANGYPGLCDQTDRIGQPVQLGLTTFEAPVGCSGDDTDCVDGRIEVVNVFLAPDADLTDTPE